MLDFSNCKISAKQYDGSHLNRGIYYNDDLYLMKIHDHVSKRELYSKYDLSDYRNNIISERITCEIIRNILDIPCQETFIGKYFYEEHKKYRDVIICKDFAGETTNISSFNGLVGDSFIVSNKKDRYFNRQNLTLDETINAIEVVEKKYGLQDLNIKLFFWKQFVIDTWIGNFDRHGGNWGFIPKGNSNYIISPIYDCGSTLQGSLKIEYAKKLSISEDGDIFSFLNRKCFSTFRKPFKEREKLNYFDFYSKKEYKKYAEEFKSATNSIIPKIDVEKVNNLIDNCDIELLSTSKDEINIRKQFIKRMLEVRYKYILLPVYNELNNINNAEKDVKRIKHMSQYIYDMNKGTLKPLYKNETDISAWNYRKNQLDSGKYKTYKNTKYNFVQIDNKICIYSYNIESESNAKEIIEKRILKQRVYY